MTPLHLKNVILRFCLLQPVAHSMPVKKKYTNNFTLRATRQSSKFASAPYRFALFWPADSLYPPVRAAVTNPKTTATEATGHHLEADAPPSDVSRVKSKLCPEVSEPHKPRAVPPKPCSLT